jgi:hypothetical protein
MASQGGNFEGPGRSGSTVCTFFASFSNDLRRLSRRGVRPGHGKAARARYDGAHGTVVDEPEG